jgi:hypothetical protein
VLKERWSLFGFSYTIMKLLTFVNKSCTNPLARSWVSFDEKEFKCNISCHCWYFMLTNFCPDFKLGILFKPILARLWGRSSGLIALNMLYFGGNACKWNYAILWDLLRWPIYDITIFCPEFKLGILFKPILARFMRSGSRLNGPK